MQSVVGLHTDADHVVLTYDDGPEPNGTDRILAALRDAGASATFFVLLTKVRRYPHLLADIVQAGHEVALHGVDHARLSLLSPVEVDRRLRSGKAELEDHLGRQVRWFRAPYGAQNLQVVEAVARSGMVPVGWDSVWHDWRDMPLPRRQRLVRPLVRRGALVLAHDGFAGPEDGAYDGRAPEFHRGELTSTLLEIYRERGLAALSLGKASAVGELVKTCWPPWEIVCAEAACLPPTKLPSRA